MSTTPANADPLIGAVLDGKYQIVGRVGAGGMGTVYRALHVSLGVPRAVKLMRKELARDPALVARFRSEARLAEGLRHPNLVALHDFGQLPDGSWYIVSEFVEGATLAALLRRRGARFTARDVARLVGQIADGLSLAHRKGIVHRDISPDNVMITRGDDDEVLAKLLDFGVAKDTRGGGGEQTGAGWNLGKLGYASPEQTGLLKAGDVIDARSDVFSLAAIAYQMVSGRLPWRKDTLQDYMHDLLLRPEEDLRAEIRRHAPAEWRELFVAALARDRDARMPGTRELKQAMIAAADSDATSVPESEGFRADMLRSGRSDEAHSSAETRTLLAGDVTPQASTVTPRAPSLRSGADPSRDPTPSPPSPLPPTLTPAALTAASLAAEWETPQAVEAPARVVVFDDDIALLGVLPLLVDSAAVSLVASPWSPDAALFAASQAPDLIVVDATQAHEVTVGRVSTIRREPRLGTVPLVLCASTDEWTLRDLVRRTRADGYLTRSELAEDPTGAFRRLTAGRPASR